MTSMKSTMSMIDWVEILCNDWWRVCGNPQPKPRQLLANTLGNYHSIKKQGVSELVDGKGKLRLNAQQDYFELQYEALINGLNLGSSRLLKEKGCTRRCDYILLPLSLDSDSAIVAVDLTSSKKNSTKTLEEEKDNSGLTKFEKVPIQCHHSIKALSLSPKLKGYIEKCQKRIAICGYTLGVGESQDSRIKDAFNRPVQAAPCIELANKDLNKLGFNYYRVCYDYTFTI